MNYQIIFDKYYPEENEQRRILLEHSRRVADKALELARLRSPFALVGSMW